ncbi:MAG: SPOR domain-containing protein [Bacillota bacterium]
MNNKNLKSGTSLLFMLGFMAIIASVFGYFISSWFLDYVTAPEDEIRSVTNNQTVEEEKIDPGKDNTQEENNAEQQSKPENKTERTEKTEQSESTEEPTIKPQNNSELFAVQVGAFSKQSNAQGLVEKLQNEGFTAYITTEDPYRVQVGAFKTKEAAKELGQELEEIGFSVYIDR